MCPAPVGVVKDGPRRQEGAWIHDKGASVIEDDEPRPKPSAGPGRNLDRMSVVELEAYVAELRAEIVRVEAAIARHRDMRSAAEALFKPRPG